MESIPGLHKRLKIRAQVVFELRKLFLRKYEIFSNTPPHLGNSLPAELLKKSCLIVAGSPKRLLNPLIYVCELHCSDKLQGFHSPYVKYEVRSPKFIWAPCHVMGTVHTSHFIYFSHKKQTNFLTFRKTSNHVVFLAESTILNLGIRIENSIQFWIVFKMYMRQYTFSAYFRCYRVLLI